MNKYSLSDLEQMVKSINEELKLEVPFYIERWTPGDGWTRWKLEQGGSDIFIGTKAEFVSFLRGMLVVARYSPKK